MGYGGTGYATVDVDIVQTDVDAIVQGLGGMGGSTLGDLWTLLSEISGNLYYWDDPTYGTKISWLEDIDAILAGVDMSLRSSSEWRSAADLLDDIRWNLNVDGYGAAWWMRDCAYSSSATAGFLSGYNYGPITDTAYSAYQIRDFLSGYNYGPLTDIAGSVSGLSEFLSNYNSVPLTDIRDSLNIDGYSVAWWLQQVENRGWDITSYLSGNWGGPLTGIEGNTWSTQDSTWQIREYLSGYNSGPLTDIASFNYEIRDHVVGYSSGPLSDMRDRLSAIEGYLWSGYWGASAADLLGDIRDHVSSIRYQTDQLTFDGNGNLRVVTY